MRLIMMNARRWAAGSVMAAVVIAVAVGLGFVGDRGLQLQMPGTARLIAFEPLPEALNDYCTWETAAPDEGIGSLPSRALASYQPAGAGGQGPGAPRDRRADVAARKPLRVIHDPYAGFSTVFVDAVRNEVVLGDEYHFNLHVYDRLAHVQSPSQKVEPKRLIGGLATNSQFVSSMYVDPKNGDIYATNNDSLRGLNIFGTSAQGNVKPDRTILSPYGSFGLTVDEARQELLLTVQHNSAILVYPKNARGDAEPIRLIQGDRTHMADPHSIALDATNRLLYVTNYGTSHGATPGAVGEKPGSTRRQFWPAG